MARLTSSRAREWLPLDGTTLTSRVGRLSLHRLWVELVLWEYWLSSWENSEMHPSMSVNLHGLITIKSSLLQVSRYVNTPTTTPSPKVWTCKVCSTISPSRNQARSFCYTRVHTTQLVLTPHPMSGSRLRRWWRRISCSHSLTRLIKDLQVEI